MTKKPTYEELEKKIQILERAELDCKQVDDTLSNYGNLSDNYLKAIDSMGVGVFIVDHDYRIRFMNEIMIKWFGNKTGLHCYKSIAELDSPCSYCQIDSVIDSGKTINYMPTIPDGRTFDITASQICNSDGSISKMEIIQDITDRKLAEDMLIEKTMYLDNILRSATEYAIATTDLNFCITYYNPLAEKFFGYTADEVIGKTVHEMHTREYVDSKRFDNAIEVIRNQGEYCYSVKQETDMGTRYLDSRASGIYDNANNLVGFALFSRDITASIKAEKKMLLHQQNLNEINKIGIIANSTLSLEVILQDILKNTLDTVNASVGMIFLKNQITGCLSWGASLGLSQNFVTAYKNQNIQIGEGLTGRIAQTGELIYIPKDSSHDPRIARSVIAEEKLNSFIGVPIYAADEIVGVMNILTRPPDILSEDNVTLCSTIGSHVGSAIRNAQLFTNLKMAKKEIQRSQERLDLAIKGAGIGLWDWNIQTGEIVFNEQWAKTVGYTLEELSPVSIKTWGDLCHPDDLKESNKLLEEHFAGKTDSYAYEARMKHKDGNWVWVLDKGRVFEWGKDGKPLRATGTHLDITELKNSEKQLKKSEEKYRSMMESMKNSSYICSPELKIEYMNPAMIKRVGTDATGEICFKAIYDRNEQCSWCVFDQIKRGEDIGYEVIDPKDNHYYSVANSPIFHSNDTVSKLTIFHDITEMKNIENQLQQSRKMESIGTLTGGIAHDFNNLLYMISGNTELALEDIPDWNPAHQNLQEIKTASLKAAGIVKQLLHFSRKTDQKLKPIGAVTVMKDSLKFLRSTIPSTIKIKTQSPDAEIPILADPIQINQIMMNLCINASHAMEKTGGTLEINIENASLDKETVNSYPDLTIADYYLKITFSDTGPGIPPETINKIFDPYFTTKEFGKGSGMGLTVVQGIIKNHDGAITVDSQVGKGTDFTILFPVIDEAPEIINKKITAIPHGTENILFVDDEKAITNMMQQVLIKLGYHVETSLNPEEALDLFQAKPGAFDVVITDMTMPQMTGAKFAEKLKEFRSDIPIILCTGHSSLIDEDKAKQSGISGYVMKPVSMSKIAKAIREALDR
ncbi:MAG: PAS domain S-box protein [Desulfobacteraceae bacterium]|nr:PAS domain S-box protein [Desulfobacteraceae bacterium]